MFEIIDKLYRYKVLILLCLITRGVCDS